jgi:hypothetical protein
MAPRDIPAQFKKLIPKALKSDAGHLEINKFIKNQIVDQGALLECIWMFASSYAANQKDMKEGPRQVGLAIYYALLMRATQLAGPMNELADFVLYIDALAIQSLTGDQPKLKFNLPKTTAQQFELYKTLWLKMPEKDRNELRAEAMKARTKLRDARTLTSVLSDAYQKEWGWKPKLDDLFDYNPAPKTSRKEFDQAVLACNTAFDQLTSYKEFRTSLELRLQQLDQAFAALRKLLMAAGADQMAYFQMWKWAREKAWERFTTNRAGEKITNPGAPSGSLYYEIYLEACYCALILAKSRWNMLQVQKSKGLPTADRDLLLGPLLCRQRPHFEKRLELGLMNPDEDHVDFDTLTRVRRRMEGFARDQGLYHLDEFETVELMNNLIWVRQNKPELIEKKVIRAVSNYPALQDKFKIDQTVMDYFTIVWAEGSGDDEKVIVEFHKFSLQLFRLPANRLDDLVRNALWKKMQELGAELIAFMLAYLELLGIVADIATAGMAGGGLRGFAIAYLKDKLLEKGTDVVLDELGVDNPYVRVLAHMGSGALHMPKGNVNVDASEVSSARKALDTGVMKDAERGLVKTGEKSVANQAVEVGHLSDVERGLAPKVDTPTVGKTTQEPIVDFQKPHANDYTVDTAKAAKKKPDADVIDINARQQQIAKQQEENVAQVLDLRKNQQIAANDGGAGTIVMGPKKTGGDGPTVGHNEPVKGSDTRGVKGKDGPTHGNKNTDANAKATGDRANTTKSNTAVNDNTRGVDTSLPKNKAEADPGYPAALKYGENLKKAYPNLKDVDLRPN